jgi:hypothetical protein
MTEMRDNVISMFIAPTGGVLRRKVKYELTMLPQEAVRTFLFHS